MILDVEATCCDDGSIGRDERETIEIGALLVAGDEPRVVAELQTLVRPRLHPRLTAFCTALTSIAQSAVDAAPPFPEALARLLALAGPAAPVWCTWGDFDRQQLWRDARRCGMAPPPLEPHVDLRRRFAAAQRTRELGLHEALRRVGLAPQGAPHRAIDDARNLLRLWPHVTPTT